MTVVYQRILKLCDKVFFLEVSISTTHAILQQRVTTFWCLRIASSSHEDAKSAIRISPSANGDHTPKQVCLNFLICPALSQSSIHPSIRPAIYTSIHATTLSCCTWLLRQQAQLIHRVHRGVCCFMARLKSINGFYNCFLIFS